MYDGLAQLLERLGAGMEHVVVEKLYFHDMDSAVADLQDIRARAYRNRGISGERLPATTYLGQSPCRPGQHVELQAYAVVPTHAQSARVLHLSGDRQQAVVKGVEIGPARDLYIGSVTGLGCEGRSSADFRTQSDAMFERALEILREHSIPYCNVLRTWLYLDDIDRDYDQLNASRNAFFERENVVRLPASTGIGARLHPRPTGCTLDLYALGNPEIADISLMHAPTLNEAPEYGSAFSRGVKMVIGEQIYLFISGTASIDPQGQVVHVGDDRRQIERMLLNIEELLLPHGASFRDLVHAVTYLKSARSFDVFRELCALRGLLDLPHTIVEADVCRPEWLCETEAIAILPLRLTALRPVSVHSLSPDGRSIAGGLALFALQFAVVFADELLDSRPRSPRAAPTAPSRA